MNNDRFEELKRTFLPRFWDTENNVMVYPELNLAKDMIYMVKINNCHIQVQALTYMLFNPRFKEMKPTGLYDKNGTLIYDDDLIRGRMKAIHEIYWDADNCGFFAKIKDEDTRFAIDKNWIESCTKEIIGNIYQSNF